MGHESLHSVHHDVYNSVRNEEGVDCSVSRTYEKDVRRQDDVISSSRGDVTNNESAMMMKPKNTRTYAEVVMGSEV